MKAVGGAIALGAVGIALQGCGGGDAPWKRECFNKQMDLVTQSIEATSVMNMELTLNGTTTNTKVTGTSKEKMDMHDFNFFFEVDGTTVSTKGDKIDDVTSWSRMVINAGKQEAVTWQKIKLATLNVTVNQCTISPMPFGKEQLKQMYPAYLEMMQKNLTCTGNDGFFDTFHGEIDVSMPPMGSMHFVTDIQMTKDYLMCGTTKMNGAMNLEASQMTTTYDYTERSTRTYNYWRTSSGSSCHPWTSSWDSCSSEDLDWSKWGVECKNASTPPGLDGPGPRAMVKLALDAKKFKPGALHFFSQFMNTPAAAHKKNKMVVV